MKRFPSMKSAVFCGFAAIALSMTIPVSPNAAKQSSSLADAIPTLSDVTVTNATNGNATNPANQTENSPSTKRQAPKSNNPSNQTQPPQATDPNKQPATDNPAPSKWESNLPSGWGYTKPKTAKLRVRVINGRTRQPLPGAEVVVIETEQRMRTDNNGYTPWIDAPVFRNPKYRPMIAELHGQLGLIVYKNGYRDSIHLGVRMHEDIRQQTTVWMYKIGPRDRRIEPVLYQEPYHHIWLIRLADKFRQKSQIGEGPERP